MVIWSTIQILYDTRYNNFITIYKLVKKEKKKKKKPI